jgi:hypothetical protein
MLVIIADCLENTIGHRRKKMVSEKFPFSGVYLALPCLALRSLGILLPLNMLKVPSVSSLQRNEQLGGEKSSDAHDVVNATDPRAVNCFRPIQRSAHCVAIKSAWDGLWDHLGSKLLHDTCLEV